MLIARNSLVWLGCLIVSPVFPLSYLSKWKVCNWEVYSEAVFLAVYIPFQRLFTKAWGGRKRRNGFKLQDSSFRWDIGSKFFTVRAVRPWHRSHREAVAAPSLQCPAWGGGGCLCPWQEVGLDGLWGLFLLKPFCNSLKGGKTPAYSTAETGWD